MPRPDDALLDGAILPSILHVKAGRLERAQPLLASAVLSLLDTGTDLAILACTEAPIALAAADAELLAACVDTTQVLADAAVALWQRMYHSGRPGGRRDFSAKRARATPASSPAPNAAESPSNG